MVSPRTSPDATPILQLLTDYSFDTDHYQADVMVTGWLQQFEPIWVSQAITEALYQGRYKMVSVDHILQLWQRRGQPLRHFNREFESIVLGQAFIYPSGKGNASASQPVQTHHRERVPAVSSHHQEPPAPTLAPPQRTIQPLTPDQLALLGQAPTRNPRKPWGLATQSSSLETSISETSEPKASEFESLGSNISGIDSPDLDRLDNPARADFSGAITLPQDPAELDAVAELETPAVQGVSLADDPVPLIAEVQSPDEDPWETSDPWDNSVDPDPANDDAEPLMDVSLGADDSDDPADAPSSAAVPNFRPVAHAPQWEAADTIQPFVPQMESSEFHQRLKAVVKAGLGDE